MWLLAANTLLIALIGIVLIILSVVLSRVATKVIINRREYNTQQDDPDVLLRVNNLSQYFKSGEFVNKAVDDISFYIKRRGLRPGWRIRLRKDHHRPHHHQPV